MEEREDDGTLDNIIQEVIHLHIFQMEEEHEKDDRIAQKNKKIIKFKIRFKNDKQRLHVTPSAFLLYLYRS